MAKLTESDHRARILGIASEATYAAALFITLRWWERWLWVLCGRLPHRVYSGLPRAVRENKYPPTLEHPCPTEPPPG